MKIRISCYNGDKERVMGALKNKGFTDIGSFTFGNETFLSMEADISDLELEELRKINGIRSAYVQPDDEPPEQKN